MRTFFREEMKKISMEFKIRAVSTGMEGTKNKNIIDQIKTLVYLFRSVSFRKMSIILIG